MANEKRLIDANHFAMGVALYMAENAYLNDTALDVLKKVSDWLDEERSVDAVEVVRCKDCKYGTKFSSERIECRLECGLLYNDDFCSYGERREDDG